MLMRYLKVAALAGGLFLAPHAGFAQADLALVMAVDVSASVNDERFKLQRDGIADGLTSRAVLDAVTAGPHATIELAIVEWSEEQSVLLDWTIIHDRADLDAVAEIVRHKERPQVGWRTNVGGGIAKAAALFDTAPLAADRKVIDVSGDGQHNSGKLTAEVARDVAIANDVTINGLPITSGEEPKVDQWYKDHVVGGAGAFMIVANGHGNFTDAMRMKLSLEVAGLSPRVALAQAGEISRSPAP
jgi:hypothetical protein